MVDSQETMPFSEFHPATKGNLESNLQSDVSSFMLENEFAELLCENGQIVMQSNRPRKPNFSSVFPSILSRTTTQDKYFSGSPKAGRIDSTANELSSSAVSNTNLSSHGDDMVPWMNYHMEDPLQNDYCCEFFSEYSGFNMTSPSNSNHFGGVTREPPNVELEHSMKPPAGGIICDKTKLSRTSEVGGSNCNSHAQQRCQNEDIPTTKPLQMSGRMGVLNFSNFSRPVALAKANLLNADRLRSNEKASTASSSNPIESTIVDSCNGLKSVSAVQRKLSPVPPPKKLELRSSGNPQGGENNADSCSRPPDCSGRHSSSHAPIVAEKGPEAIVASSVCSGSTAGTNDLKQSGKRKNTEGDESGYQSEDLEDESIDIKKSAGKGVSAKRSRAAEVHNLSERRRRDRINDRMRALQELIPNCNKVDKASMLDEAIEYLKTLQLQVQIMSMGTGLCAPPMMLPNGMQLLQGPSGAHFPVPMSLGMGAAMGMRYGIGMLDMHGSPGWQLPRMGMPGSSNVQMLGIPGQCLGMGLSQMAHPPPPPFSSFSCPSVKGPKVSAPGNSSTPQGDTASRDNQNLDAARKSGGIDDSKAHTSTQV